MTDEDKGQLVVEDYNPDTYARSSRALPRAQIRATGDLCRSAMACLDNESMTILQTSTRDVGALQRDGGTAVAAAKGSSGGACSAPQKSTRQGHGRE